MHTKSGFIEDLNHIMKAAVVLYNMIGEERKSRYVGDGAGGLPEAPSQDSVESSW